MFFSVGTLVIYSFGLFANELAQEFDWNRIEVYLALAAFNYGVVFSAPFFGFLIDRYGVRKVVLVSTFLFSPCYALIATMNGSLLLLYFVFGAIAIIGGGTLPISYSRQIVGWFNRSRGLALGLTLSGVGLGAALLPPLVQLGIDNVGWRFTVLILAGCVILISFPAAWLFLKDSNTESIDSNTSISSLEQMKDQAIESWTKVLSNSTFWILMFFSLVSGIFLIGAIAHFVPLMVDQGISAQSAAGYASVIGLSVIFGRIGIGVLVDRFFAPRVIFVFFLAPIFAFLAIRFLGGEVTYFFAAIGIGCALGAEVDVIAYLVSKYFGWAHYGRLYGLMFAAYTIGAANGPLILGAFYESNQNYDDALLFLTIMPILAAVSICWLPKFPENKA